MPFFWGGETEWTLILIRMMFECISMMLLVFHGGEIKPTDFFITTYIYTYIPILHPPHSLAVISDTRTSDGRNTMDTYTNRGGLVHFLEAIMALFGASPHQCPPSPHPVEFFRDEPFYSTRSAPFRTFGERSSQVGQCVLKADSRVESAFI